MRIASAALILLSAFVASTTGAFAWGADGHRIINGDAIRALPTSMPAFVRAPAAITEIATLGPEADRLRDAGAAYYAAFAPAHFLDLDDDGTVAGAVPLANLPPTREAYDTALRARGHLGKGRAADQYTLGYLPYAIIEGWQQVVEDFAIWRVDSYGETHAVDAAARAAFTADRTLREVLTLRDIGYWGHFIADGSQPLHVSVHYNGWGDYPNPNGYTQAHTIHAYFETHFVEAHATPELVLAHMRPSVPFTQPFPATVAAYLQATASNVPMVYQLDKAGAFNPGTPQAIDFMLDRVAAGAQMLRDSIVAAYAASETEKVGYPGATVHDIEGGLAPLAAALGS